MRHGVEVEVVNGGPGYTMWLFPATEPLHVWRTDMQAEPTKLPMLQQAGHVRRFDFAPGEKFKVAWQGCDVVYLNKQNDSVRYDLVQVIQEQPTSQESITRVFKGYTSKEILPMEAFENGALIIKPIVDPEDEEPVAEISATEATEPPAEPVPEELPAGETENK